MAEHEYTKALEPAKYDRRIYDTVFGEAGGGKKAEIAATASVYVNRTEREGYESALLGSSSYRYKHPQYRKASEDRLNSFEKIAYRKVKRITDEVIKDKNRKKYYYMENFVDLKKKRPYWVGKDTAGYEDVERQRFYFRKEKK